MPASVWAAVGVGGVVHACMRRSISDVYRRWPPGGVSRSMLIIDSCVVGTEPRRVVQRLNRNSMRYDNDGDDHSLPIQRPIGARSVIVSNRYQPPQHIECNLMNNK